MAGNRTRINCLEGNYADHYTTIALEHPGFIYAGESRNAYLRLFNLNAWKQLKYNQQISSTKKLFKKQITYFQY